MRERKNTMDDNLQYVDKALIFRFYVEYLCLLYREIYEPKFVLAGWLDNAKCIFDPDHNVTRTNTVLRVFGTSKLTPRYRSHQ